MKVFTTYPHKLVKLTQIIDYTLDEKAFFIDECEGREVWSTIKMASLFQIYLRPNEDIFRVQHQIRMPEDETYHPHKEVVKDTIEEARAWIREEMQDENLENTYKRIKLADQAMEAFYSQENRSNYLYNE